MLPEVLGALADDMILYGSCIMEVVDTPNEFAIYRIEPCYISRLEID